ncbi:MAG: hypothetical protein IAI48_08980, partial [Candidatus Eremiobacteraeota bacterium]|nr:hypothetical protein [Candidatus Eremiobacteraeota bacterium]
MTRRRAIRFALFACVVVALVAFRAPLARAFVCAALDVVTGDAVSFDALDVTPERIEGAGVRVMRGAVPLFVADHILVRYRLGEFFGGGTRRYGLERVLVVRPRVTLVRRADGGFDGVPEVAAGGSGPAAG